MQFDARRSSALLPLQMSAPEIERWLLDKEPAAIGAYNSIAPDEYARAFTAARTAGTDVADDLYFAMVDTVSRGGSEQDFSRLVVPILKRKGWLGGDEGQIARRVELIYDTNLRLARASGRWDKFWSTRSAFPYLLGFTVGDERVRHPPHSPHSDHRAWDGICLPIDHPFWREYWTPLGFRCRCGIRQLTRSQFARLKSGVTSEADLAERKARLGPPVFLAPSRPIADQLSAMTDRTNANRMPTMPAVQPVQAAAVGRAAYEGDMREGVTAQLAAELEAIGLGAILRDTTTAIERILARFDAPDLGARLSTWARFRRRMEKEVQRDPGSVDARLALEEARRIEAEKRG